MATVSALFCIIPHNFILGELLSHLIPTFALYYIIFKNKLLPCLVWLSGLSAGLQTKGLLV